MVILNGHDMIMILNTIRGSENMIRGIHGLEGQGKGRDGRTDG